MEVRILQLERSIDRVDARIEKVDDRLRTIETSTATLLERIAHLPGKGFIVGTTLTSLAVVTAFITFGEKLQSWFN